MKVLFDMREVQFAQNRGIGNYSICLIKALVENHPDISFDYLVDCNLETLPSDAPRAKLVFLDRLEYLDDSYDVFFSMGMFSILTPNNMREYLIPSAIRYRSKIIVGIVYDLIVLIFEDHYLQDKELKGRFLDCLEAVKEMDHLFCISQSTKEDFLHYSGIEENRTSIIRGGGKALPTVTSSSYNFNLRSNTVVYIGGDDYRKNLIKSAKAFAKAYNHKKVPADSVYCITCRVSKETRATIAKVVEQNRISGHLVLTGYLPDEILVQLVRSAKATFFPSLYEGLGMPVLESYSLMTPVFAGNNSSLIEITCPSCSFDASDEESMISAFGDMFSNKAKCNESILFGQEILSRFSWQNAEQQVYQKLVTLLAAHAQINALSTKVGVCTSLPPDENGVATFAAKLFGKYPDDFFFFSSSERFCAMDELLKLNDMHSITVFSIDTLIGRASFSEARGQLYVIGNSGFSTAVLEEAIRSKNSTKKRLAYFHDGNNCHALYSYMGGDLNKLKVFLCSVYPDKRSAILSVQCIEDLDNLDIACFLPILLLTKINEVIVTTEQIKKRLCEDIGNRLAVRTDVVPLPIELIHIQAPLRFFDSDTLVIGHFGYPSEHKQLTKLIGAVRLLQEGRKCGLVLAGFGDLVTIAKQSGLGDSVVVLSSPSQEILYQAMAGVDIAVQLRFPFQGESSGCIHELLGLGKQIVATKGFVDRDLSDLVLEVEPTITPEQLAMTIHNVHTSRFKENMRSSSAVARRSMDKLVTKILSIMER